MASKALETRFPLSPERLRKLNDKRARVERRRRRRRTMIKLLVLLVAAAALSVATYRMKEQAKAARKDTVEAENPAESAVRGFVQRLYESLLGWGDAQGDRYERRRACYVEAADLARQHSLDGSEADTRLAELDREIRAARPVPLGEGCSAELMSMRRDDVFPLLYLDVAVAGADGSPLNGLQLKDFSLVHGGLSQKFLGMRKGVANRGRFSLLIVIDTSDSTAGVPLQQAKSGTSSLIRSLSPETEVRLLSFSDGLEAHTDWTTDRNAVARAVDGLTSGGKTALYRAIGTVEAELCDRSRPCAALVFSDGRDTVGGVKPNGYIDALKRQGVPCYAVSLASGETDRELLTRLSDATGGVHLEAQTVGTLVSRFNEIARRLKTPTYRLVAPMPDSWLDAPTLQIGSENRIEVALPSSF